MSNSTFHAVLKDLQEIPVFSEHCHHRPDEFFRQPMSLEVLINNSYINWTGLHLDGTVQARKRLLEHGRFNTYFTWFWRGLQKVHYLNEDLTLDSWEAISETVRSHYAADADLHWHAMQKEGFDRAILDTFWSPGEDNGHPELFIPTFRIDKFTYGLHAQSIAPDDFPVWPRYGFTGGTLDDFVGMMLDRIRKQFHAGKVAAFKCAEAYLRDINFLPDDRAAALSAFGKHPDQATSADQIAFSNYIFCRACELAQELDVPFQIHTGLARLAGSNPLLFEPIIARYPRVRFVLFHSGYPWIREVAALAHNYSNVLPSLCWTPAICTSAAITALHEYLDTASSCRCITWGDDCWVPEESVGALLAWRFVIAKVLSERLDDGRLNARQAQELGQMLLLDNGRHVYPRAVRNS